MGVGSDPHEVNLNLHLSQHPARQTKTRKHIPSDELTWQWKMDLLKMYSLLKMGIFHCHVSLLEGIYLYDIFLEKQPKHIKTHTYVSNEHEKCVPFQTFWNNPIHKNNSGSTTPLRKLSSLPTAKFSPRAICENSWGRGWDFPMGPWGASPLSWLVGWWLNQPIWKIWSSNWIISPMYFPNVRGEDKNVFESTI